MSTTEKQIEDFMEGNQKKEGKMKLRSILLWFVILHIRKAQLKYVKIYAAHQSKWNINPTVPYDQIVTCADLNSKSGACFLPYLFYMTWKWL